MLEVRRISLPSGGWWAIRTRPTWQDVGALGDGIEGRLEQLLVNVTEAWSFEDAISLDALARIDDGDMAAVMQVVIEDVLPWLDQDSPEEMAKGLFAGMSTGQVPEEFLDVQLMDATGWSWQVLQSAPADVVLKMAIFLAVSQVKAEGGALQFPPDLRSWEAAEIVQLDVGSEGDKAGD
ncbi:MAG: hypothetical protein O2821_03770 [Chloroflexi bacterium]|nr:hypothetical protein [Chloroflexota bacterium]MDA1228369.1 hypothetical protein [Chloroflexota bacterium]